MLLIFALIHNDLGFFTTWIAWEEIKTKVRFQLFRTFQHVCFLSQSLLIFWSQLVYWAISRCFLIKVNTIINLKLVSSWYIYSKLIFLWCEISNRCLVTYLLQINFCLTRKPKLEMFFVDKWWVKCRRCIGDVQICVLVPCHNLLSKMDWKSKKGGRDVNNSYIIVRRVLFFFFVYDLSTLLTLFSQL